MKNVPWLSLIIGIPLALAVYKYSPLIPKTTVLLSLSLSLMLSELGALLTLAALFVGGRKLMRHGPKLREIAGLIGNLMLLLVFAYIGLELWAKSQLAG